MGVIVYSISNCPKCSAAKALLRRNNVAFQDFNVQNDKEKAKEMVEKRRAARPEGSTEVFFPVLDIEGIIIEGYDKEKILAALKGEGLGK